MRENERFNFITTYLSDVDAERNAGRVATDDGADRRCADAGDASAAAADESSCEEFSVACRVSIEVGFRFASMSPSVPSTLTSTPALASPVSASPSASVSASPLASGLETVSRRPARRSRRRPRRRNPRERRCSRASRDRRSAKNQPDVL